MNMMSLYRALYILSLHKEQKELLGYARNNLSAEDFEKLKSSRKHLIIFQSVPTIAIITVVITTLIFVPYEEVPKGYANLQVTILLFSTVIYIFFLVFWLILSQLLFRRALWHNYVKWFRQKGTIDELHLLFSGNQYKEF